MTRAKIEAIKRQTSFKGWSQKGSAR